MLRAALNARCAARDEELRARYVGPGGGPPEASVARHAKLPAVFAVPVAG